MGIPPVQQNEESNAPHTMTPIPPKKSPKNRRQSWADITMENVDVSLNVNHEKGKQFKSFKPINQKQGVSNLNKEFRKSLGHNEIKSDLEALKKEYPQIVLKDTSNRQQNDDAKAKSENEELSVTEDEDDEFFSDEELEATQQKY